MDGPEDTTEEPRETWSKYTSHEGYRRALMQRVFMEPIWLQMLREEEERERKCS